MRLCIILPTQLRIWPEAFVNSAQIRINGVILAGGKGSRMNFAQKPLLELGGKRIIDWIIQSASPQVQNLIINVNQPSDSYTSLGLPLVPDDCGSHAGPLAGILTAMSWCRINDPLCTHLACFPGDVPWFDDDFVARLHETISAHCALIGWLQTHLQFQPLFSLWDLRVESSLKKALENGAYSPMAFIRTNASILLCMGETNAGYYLNVNTPEDLEAARILALKDIFGS